MQLSLTARLEHPLRYFSRLRQDATFRWKQVATIPNKNDSEESLGGNVAVVIRVVKDVLEPRGLESPDLAVLQATHQSYRTLLLQPGGPIYADTARIGPLDVGAAEQRSDHLLAMAAERGDQLVVTPEYYLPIASLRKCAKGPTFPAPGALWVLGCESMTPAQLQQLKEECSSFCDIIFEDDPAPQVQGNYFDPVAYCFVTQDAEGNYKKVIILQFKTAPSRDEHGFENKQLRCGQAIYQFRGKGDLIGITAIICSDAFSLGEDAAAIKKLTDRTILIHIQLNPKPKHTDYRRYRNEVFRKSAALTDCDIICLNWAQDMVQYDALEKPPANWNNESGSAWYLPERRCSVNDNEVEENEAKGLYYTWHSKKRHVLHLHYDEAVFALTVPKVLQDGPAIQDNSIGPLLDGRFCWNNALKAWTECTTRPETGWSQTITADTGVSAAFQSLQDNNTRLHIERAISLSCGHLSAKENWYNVKNLDVCRINEDEIVRRTTLRLDRDNAAKTDRNKRIHQVATLNHILATEPLPLPIKDLAGGGVALSWTPGSPNTNVSKPGVRPALVAYLGEDPLPDLVHNVGKVAFELLRIENESHKNRVAVCYRTLTGIKFADIKELRDITYDGSSMTSITNGD